MSKAAPYVFISYPRSESAIVGRIAKFLEESGISTWRDVDDIAPGESWAKSIEDAVSQADAFLYVVGDGSQQSPWMLRELAAVMTRQANEVCIIPIATSQKGFEALPDFARRFQGIDLTIDLEAGLQAIVDQLSGLAKTNPSPKSSHPRSKGYAFISYAAEDADFLGGLKQFLGSERYGYWDFHENKRDYELQFHLELEGVIRDSEVMLCVISHGWKHSRWTAREFLFAEEIRKPVFLLKANCLEPTLLISGSSYIDFTVNRERGFRELHRELAARGL